MKKNFKILLNVFRHKLAFQNEPVFTTGTHSRNYYLNYVNFEKNILHYRINSL